MKCAEFLKTIKDKGVINCTIPDCEKSLCIQCINISVLSAEKKTSRNVLTAVLSKRKICPILESQNVTLLKKKLTLRLLPWNKNTTESEIQELTNVIARLACEFASIKAKLEEDPLAVSLPRKDGRACL